MNKTGKKKFSKYLTGYLFIAPICLGVMLFMVVPLLYSLYISFTKFDGANAPVFVGAGNYIKILGDDPYFWKVLGNTFYAATSIFLSMLLSLLLALALNNITKGIRVFRTIFYIPSICSVIAMSLVWKWMFNADFGLLNGFLGMFGIDGPGWISSKTWAMPSMIINAVWGSLGFNILMFLAAIKNVPKTYYEAAEIDGAGGWKKFIRITFPSISPVTFFILVTSIISALQDFVRFMVLTEGGPGEHTTTTIVYYIWLNAFRYHGSMGYAAAMSWILGIVIMVMTVINFKAQNRWVHYE